MKLELRPVNDLSSCDSFLECVKLAKDAAVVPEPVYGLIDTDCWEDGKSKPCVCYPFYAIYGIHHRSHDKPGDDANENRQEDGP